LQWLVYSARPLRIKEVVKVLAIETEGELRFDSDGRFEKPRDILSICSSLITTVSTEHNVARVRKVEVEELRLAHFSVQEYLVSGCVRGKAENYRIQEVPSNKIIAKSCLAYLLHFDSLAALTTEDLIEFPLARYSAQY
jgi:hypothetical protein